MKSTIIEMKISLEVLKHRFEQAEERFSELEDRTTEITASEEHKEKRLLRSIESMRDLWDTIKQTNTCIAEVSGEEREKGTTRVLEEIMAGNSPTL